MKIGVILKMDCFLVSGQIWGRQRQAPHIDFFRSRGDEGGGGRLWRFSVVEIDSFAGRDAGKKAAMKQWSIMNYIQDSFLEKSNIV